MNNVPLETVIVGDIIHVSKEYKDTIMSFKATVARILAEGRKRTLYTGEGVELASYVVGRKTPRVVLVKRADEPHSMLGMFA